MNLSLLIEHELHLKAKYICRFLQYVSRSTDGEILLTMKKLPNKDNGFSLYYKALISELPKTMANWVSVSLFNKWNFWMEFDFSFVKIFYWGTYKVGVFVLHKVG